MGSKPRPMSDRFWEKVDKTGECWIWVGAITKTSGYGAFNCGNYRYDSAHRVSVRLSGREIPKGMFVDHMCRTRSCVRPDHLRIVTPAVNVLENSRAPSAFNKLKTHCKRGHELSEDNLVGGKTRLIGRDCKKCRCLKERDRRIAANGGIYRGPQPPPIIRGEANSLSRLTEVKVLKIRKLAKAGARQVDLAKQFGVHRDTIANVVLRKNWKHI